MKTPVMRAKDGVTISVYVQPGAADTGWAGFMGEALKLRVTGRPVDGQANRQVCSFVAEYFRVPKSAVRVQHGASSRNKVLHVCGAPDILMNRLETLIADRGT